MDERSAGQIVAALLAMTVWVNLFDTWYESEHQAGAINSLLHPGEVTSPPPYVPAIPNSHASDITPASANTNN